jgi:hypothetical protein
MANQNNQPTESLIGTIPEPAVIRSRMVDLMREQDLLRAMLKVAERKQQLFRRSPPPQEVAHAS